MHSKPSGQETVLAAAEVGRTQAALSLKAFLPASTVCLKTRYLSCALGGPHSSLLPVYHMGPDFSQPSGPQERLEKEKRLTSDLGRAATKLQELLKTTQGQLTKERDTVKKLQEQLEKAVSTWCRLDCRASIPPEVWSMLFRAPGSRHLHSNLSSRYGLCGPLGAGPQTLSHTHLTFLSS